MSYYVLLALSWGVYFFIHSLFASTGCKRYFEKHMWIFFKYYRVLYTVFSSIGLLALLVFNALGKERVIEGSQLTRYAGLLGAAIGVIIIRESFRHFSLKGFLGIEPESRTFVVKGIHSRIRHPIYTGTIMIVLGFLLYSPTYATLVTTCCVLIYLPIGIRLEERKLVVAFGEEYMRYKKRVPALFPRFFS